MAEDEGLEPTRPKSPVFKTGALPIMLILRAEKAGVIGEGIIAGDPGLIPVVEGR